VTSSEVFQASCCYQGFVTSFSSVKSFVKMLKKSRINASMLIILGTGKSLRSFVTKHPNMRRFVDQNDATEWWWDMLINSGGIEDKFFTHDLVEMRGSKISKMIKVSFVHVKGVQ